MVKAVIGISASEVTIQSGPFMGEPRTYVNAAYVDSVLKNGGIPLVIPFTAGGEEMAFKQLDLVDGLILSGGHDLNPHLYGEEIDQKSGETWPDRDAFDMALLKRAEETGKPVLGTHVVKIKSGTTLKKIMGESSLMTNSFHHQLIKEVAPDLTESASASDGVTEALESTDGKVIAVQWHPEEMHANPAPEAAIMNRLFKYLIDKAEEEKQ
ncbi:gamma-glutamyl-gamma-aminobutyrate hydrolase family protein [Lactobacillus delbrueckii subsp. bulgaricus]|nr:gamma-glutamyl-gamma-aminobutyrate hydrolase [Lactobacillus delbrueckii subsp. bulgaricus]